jgi:tRNA(fMet)-specific endonuclease VapC
MAEIIHIRQQVKLKLPDAIIAATAIQSGASLITADQEFSKLTTLTVVGW